MTTFLHAEHAKLQTLVGLLFQPGTAQREQHGLQRAAPHPVLTGADIPVAHSGGDRTLAPGMGTGGGLRGLWGTFAGWVGCSGEGELTLGGI